MKRRITAESITEEMILIAATHRVDKGPPRTYGEKDAFNPRKGIDFVGRAASEWWRFEKVLGRDPFTIGDAKKFGCEITPDPYIRKDITKME